MSTITIDLGSLCFRDVVVYRATGAVCIAFEDSDGDTIQFKLERGDQDAVLHLLHTCVNEIRLT